MRIAFLYPGQGSQQRGMGASVLEDREVASLCAEASSALGIDLRQLVTEADDEVLRATENAQPALCFTEIALTQLLARRGVVPQAAAGHSVAEYAALCAAGALSPLDAMRAVKERGLAMGSAVPAGESGMAAVLGLDAETVDGAIREIEGAWIANYNTPSQVVIGGRAEALETASEALRSADAKRVVPLNVSAAFHTPLMRSAAERLRAALDRLDWHMTSFPVVANVSAEPYADAAEMPVLLERQLYSPVRWGDCVKTLTRLGIEGFVEVGPKRTLTGMLRELAPGAYTASVATQADIAQLELPVAR